MVVYQIATVIFFVALVSVLINYGIKNSKKDGRK